MVEEGRGHPVGGVDYPRTLQEFDEWFPSEVACVEYLQRVRWAEVAATVRANCGPHFEDLLYRDTYRDPERLGPDKKSLLLSISLRSKEGTLTNQEADAIRDQIVAACREKHGAELRG